MILNSILAAILLVFAPQADHFNRERPALQQSVDGLVNPIVGRLLQPSKATYLEGYGVVVTLEVALTTPRTPFSSSVSPSDVQATVAQQFTKQTRFRREKSFHLSKFPRHNLLRGFFARTKHELPGLIGNIRRVCIQYMNHHSQRLRWR